jgi:hypothetical protein
VLGVFGLGEITIFRNFETRKSNLATSDPRGAPRWPGIMRRAYPWSGRITITCRSLPHPVA